MPVNATLTGAHPRGHSGLLSGDGGGFKIADIDPREEEYEKHHLRQGPVHLPVPFWKDFCIERKAGLNMIYLDSAAAAYHRPDSVAEAVAGRSTMGNGSRNPPGIGGPG